MSVCVAGIRLTLYLLVIVIISASVTSGLDTDHASTSEKEVTESSYSRVKRGTEANPDYPWGQWTTWGPCEALCGDRRRCRYRRCYTYDCGSTWKEEKYFQYKSCGAFAEYSWHFERVSTDWSSTSSPAGEQWEIKQPIQWEKPNDTVKQPFGYFYEIKGVYFQNINLTTRVPDLPTGNYCFLGHLWKSGKGSVSLSVDVDFDINADRILKDDLDTDDPYWPQRVVPFSIKHSQSVRLIITARTDEDIYKSNSYTVIRADDLHLLKGSCNSVWSPDSEKEEEWNSTECSCINKTITYLRYCTEGQACLGDYRHSNQCTPDCTDEWKPWNYWSSCSESCGIGTRTRTRACSGDKCLDVNGIGSEEKQECDRSCEFIIGCTFENKQGCSEFLWQTVGDKEKEKYRWERSGGLDPSFVPTYRKAPTRTDPAAKDLVNNYLRAADYARTGNESSLQTRKYFENGTYCVEFDFHVSEPCELRLLVREQPKNRELFKNSSSGDGWHRKKVEVHGSGFTLDFMAIKRRKNSRTIGVVSVDNIFIYNGSCEAKWSPWVLGKCIGYGNDSFRSCHRTCENGSNCIGKDREIKNCPFQPYPELPSWGNCDVTCGLGTRTRIYNTGKKDIGRCYAGIPCKRWSEWTPCTQTCGNCTRTRKRNREVETQNYHDKTTPIHCPDCGTWHAWTECDKNCGRGYRKRWRTCNSGGLCGCPLYDISRCVNDDCPDWNSWSVWGRCSSSCGPGYRKRQRTCKGGTTERCEGAYLETEHCNMASCREPSWLSWNAWSRCSQTCGEGIQYRERTCSVGSTCVGRTVDTRLCVNRSCEAPCHWLPWLSWSPCASTVKRKRRTRDVRRGTSCRHITQYEQIVPCTVTRTSAWGSWTNWLECSFTCKGGQQIRSRVCNAGSNCVGGYIESRLCNNHSCPAWSLWTEWSCSVTCGNGVKTRNRTCSFGSDCVGPAYDYSKCSLYMCPEWNTWGAWSPCSKTCGEGEKITVRACKQSEALCAGQGFKVAPCFGPPCPVWLSWEQWSSCSADCGYSIRTRNRNCTAGLCPGSSSETEECPKPDCKDVGKWVQWTPWSPANCIKTCGGGIQSRKGRCSKKPCVGYGTETRICNDIPCPGQWGEWLDWSGCECDRRNRNTTSGTRKRVRICSPSNCQGVPYEEDGCKCPGLLEPWEKWGSCSVSCGGGTIVRIRKCTPQNTCKGQLSQSKLCQQRSCTGFWGAWSNWSKCSETCGRNGQQNQTRTCLRSGACTSGPPSRSRACNNRTCPGKWDKWTSWHCNVTCGNGNEIRNRTCRNLSNEGECQGPKVIERLCRKNPCYGDWAKWSDCSTTCGKGKKKRIRPCTTPGCTPDIDKSEEEEDCSNDPCPGDWGTWGPWTRDGTNETRTRTCLKPPCPGEEKGDRHCEKCWVPGSWGSWGAWHCDAGCGEKTWSERTRRCLPEYPGIICDGSPTESGNLCKGVCFEKCKAGADLIFVVDSSDSVKENDWSITKKFLIDLIRPQVISAKDKQVALITYSTNVRVEFGFKEHADTNAMVRHIEQLMHTKGSTNTQEALIKMRDELASQNTRRNVKKIGVIITDGHSKSETPVAEVATEAKDAGIILIAVGVTEDIGEDELNVIASDPDLVFPVGSLLEVAERVAEVHNAICNASEQSWGPWNDYSPCNASCGEGKQIRERRCMSYNCYGKAVSTKHCYGNCRVQWSQYSQCSVTCGKGTQRRTEICPSGQCSGPERSQARECNLSPCTVQWGPWSQCSVTCGKGYEIRKETCPSGQCTGEPRSDARECNLGPCRVQWGPWSRCSVTCGKGYEMRTEICPSGQCTGEPRSEARECNRPKCQVRWGQWSQCSVSCGRGIETRTELCLSGQCTGQERSQARECNLDPCDVRWGQWSQCSVSCGRGIETRTELCLSGQCSGQERSQARECNLDPCDVRWGPWSECSVSCGRGIETRTELCLSGQCTGQERSQARECNLDPCDVPWGQWSPCSARCGRGTQTRNEICPSGQCTGQERSQARECNEICRVIWEQWSSCSETCGKGTSTRTEICQPGQCNGQERSQARECILRACPVQWGPWSLCSMTCGKGTETRKEVCQPGPCTGDERTQDRDCNLRACPVIWGQWSSCSETCGKGTSTRTEICQPGQCNGQERSQARECNLRACPVQWDQWSSCTVTCGIGTRTRREVCPFGQCSGQERLQTVECDQGTCRVFGPWSACSSDCGSGIQSRSQLCMSESCVDRRETRDCMGEKCHEWGPWSQCTTECGLGTRIRTERCKIQQCNRQPRTEESSCTGDNCKVWGTWTPCSESCGTGVQSQTELCSNNRCTGPFRTISRTCSYGDCRVWGAWLACSPSCGSGTQSRTERCSGNCAGQPQTQTRYCQGTSCPVIWGPWSDMICPVTCGYAMGYRRRTCTSGFCSVQSETRSGICNVTCPVVCQNISDICFIMDSSGSVGIDGWEQSKNFIISLVQRLRIGPALTRAALIIFSDSAHIEFDFNRYKSNSDLIIAIRGLRYVVGGTYFGPALIRAREVFTEQRGARPEAKDVVVFLTDGEALDNFETEAQKVKDRGIIIFSVGVGSIHNKQLETLASDKSYVFHAAGFQNLTKIVDTVADRTCRSIQPVFGEWSQWSACSVTCGQGVIVRAKACLQGLCSSAVSESSMCMTPSC